MTTLHRDLWPEDIKSDDAITPHELLENQAELLERRTKGLLTAEVVRHEADDRIVLGFEVVSARISERQRLFEVQHRPEFEYPVAIIPPEETLPDYLKSRYYLPTFQPPVAPQSPGQPVATNSEWLATSPEDFANKIETVLKLPTVKAAVISLLSRAKHTNNGGSEPPVEISE